MGGAKYTRKAIMVPQDIGTIQALWRYPVKSMQGEQIPDALLTEYGILGDRAYAIIEQTTGSVASAKHPRKWKQLLACRAVFLEAPQAGHSLPPVAITLPDTTIIRSDDPTIHRRLSEVFGNNVRLERMPAQYVMRETDRTPLDADDSTPIIRDDPLALAAPSATYFDVAPIHLLTTATLAQLQVFYPNGQWDVRRFRPNIVIANGTVSFPEQAWLNQSLGVGTEVQLHIIDPCPRCVVTTLQQGDLAPDVEILRALAQHTKSTSVTLVPDAVFSAVAGVYAQVQRVGKVAYGDNVRCG